MSPTVWCCQHQRSIGQGAWLLRLTLLGPKSQFLSECRCWPSKACVACRANMVLSEPCQPDRKLLPLVVNIAACLSLDQSTFCSCVFCRAACEVALPWVWQSKGVGACIPWLETYVWLAFPGSLHVAKKYGVISLMCSGHASSAAAQGGAT